MSPRHSFQADFTIAGCALLVLVALFSFCALVLGAWQPLPFSQPAPEPSGLSKPITTIGTPCRNIAPHSLGECTGELKETAQ